MSKFIDSTGGPGPGRGHGNRTWGTERPGTKAHAFATTGWAAFDECKRCQALPGEPCTGHDGKSLNAELPCRDRKLGKR